MSEDIEIYRLLKKIRREHGYKSIEELNSAIMKLINKAQDKSTIINFVLDTVSQRYSTTRIKLVKSNSRGDMELARRTAYCLLNIEVGLSLAYISKRVFFRSQPSISNGVKYLGECSYRIPCEREFLETYKKLQKELIIFIDNQD